MIEAATLGVIAEYVDKGADKGLESLDDHARKVQKSMTDAGDSVQTGFGAKIASIGQQIVPGFVGGVQKINAALTGLSLAAAGALAGLGAALTAFGVKAVQAGSDAQEMLSKFDAVFKGQAGAVSANLEQMAASVNRSKFELQGMAASVQDMFVPMGFARDEAASLSQELTKLAIDVGSFNNMADTDVMERFNSALVGNHEAVRQFGIIITETSLNAELLRMGIEGGTRAASEQEKVMARLNLIMAGTTDAQGDAERTAGSWANMMRKLQTSLSDVVTEIGLKLLPVIEPLLEQFIEFAQDAAPQVIAAAGDMIGALQDMITWVQGLGDEFDNLARRADAGADRIRIKAQQLGADTHQIAADQRTFWDDVFMHIDQWIDNMGARFSHYIESLSRGFATLGGVWDLVTSGDLQGALDLLAYSFELDEEAIVKTNEQIVTWNEVVDYAISNGLSYSDALFELRTAHEDTTGAIHTTTEALAEHRDMIGQVGTAVNEEAAPAAQELVNIWADALAAMDQVTVQGMDTSRQAVLDGFAGLADEAAGHAQALVQLEQDKSQMLQFIEWQHQQNVLNLQAQGNQAGLAMEQQRFQSEQAATVAYFNSRIQLEQAGQQGVFDTAKQYYVATLSVMMRQLIAQVNTVRANMQAMVKIVSSGYSSMAAAALAYNKIKEGMTDIGAINAAMAEVQAAMAAVEGAAINATNQASAAFDDWTASVGDLGGALDTTAGSLANLTRPSGGGGTRPQMLDPLETAAQMAERLAGMVTKAIDAFDALAAFGSPAAGWQDAFEALTDAIMVMVRGFAEAVAEIKDDGLLEEDARNGLLQFAEMVNRVMGAFSAAARTVAAVAETEAVEIAAGVTFLADQMALMAREIGRIGALFEDDELEELAEIAGNIAAALKPWETAAKAVTAIAGAAALEIGPASERLFGQMQGLIFKMRRFEDLVDDELLTSVSELAERIVDALAPYEAAAGVVDAIAEATVLRVGPAADRLFGQMTGLIWKMRRFEELVDDELLTQVAGLADRIVDALEPYRATADTVNAIAEASERQIGPAAERLFGQMTGLIWKMRRFDDLVSNDLLAQVAAIAPRIVEALSPWQVAIETVTAIGESTSMSLGSKAERLVEQMASLALALANATELVSLDELEHAARVARYFEEALAPWEMAIRVADNLRLWREMPDLQERMTRFARTWVLIVADLADAVSTLEDEGLTAVGDFGEALETLMGGLEAALAVAADFEFEEPSSELWGNFTTWVQEVFNSFYFWVNQMTTSDYLPGTTIPLFGGAGLQALDDFAGALESLMGGLESALSIATDFQFSEPDPAMWNSFTTWVQSVFVSFYDWINQSGSSEPGGVTVPLFGDDGVAAVSAFAGALQALMGGLESALAVARDFEFTAPDASQWDAFFLWTTTTFQEFYDLITTTYPIDPEDPGAVFAPVAAWADALGSLMGGLQGALAVARDFEFTAPDAATWDTFFLWTTTTFQDFYDLIVTTYPVEDPEGTFAPVAAWGNALGSLMGGLQGALATASDFEFETPDAEQWDAFFDWVTDVMAAFAAEIAVRYPLEDPGFEPIGAFGDALGALMGGLQSALATASQFEFEPPDPLQWEAFFTWVHDTLEAFRLEIETNYPDAGADQFAPVVAWAEALGSLMQALQDATALADGFAFIPPNALGWDLFFDWVWDVFEAFEQRVHDEFPEDPEEAIATFAPVIAFSDALAAIFTALQDAFSFFMDMQGPGAAFWEWLAGAGDPETSPFAQQMGYIIGAITGVMNAFEAWVLEDAPGWLSDANVLLDNVQDVIDVLQDALDLFDVASGVTFPSSTEIQTFVDAVLDLFVTFAQGIQALLTGDDGLGSNVDEIGAIVAGLPDDITPVIDDWGAAGEDLAGALIDAIHDSIGSATEPNTLKWAIDGIMHEVVSFSGWWIPNVGEPAWYIAGDELVDAFIDGMNSNVGEVYNAAFAIGEAAGQGLIDGAGLGTPEGYAPEGGYVPYGGMGPGGWGAGAGGETRQVEVIVRFEGSGLDKMDRRQLDQLKDALVYEIRRGA